MPSLFPNDFAYLQAALQHIRQASPLQLHCYPDEQRVELTAPEDLARRPASCPEKSGRKTVSFCSRPTRMSFRERSNAVARKKRPGRAFTICGRSIRCSNG
jgi:hypothetical protein